MSVCSSSHPAVKRISTKRMYSLFYIVLFVKYSMNYSLKCNQKISNNNFIHGKENRKNSIDSRAGKIKIDKYISTVLTQFQDPR